MIKKILQIHKIHDYFSMILGKHGPKPDWENMHDKANLMIKLTKLVGVGLERMVFIGDNDSDYCSAKQIRVNFIESRVVAKEENIGSMVHNLENESIEYFDSYADQQLELILEKMNRELKLKNFSHSFQ